MKPLRLVLRNAVQVLVRNDAQEDRVPQRKYARTSSLLNESPTALGPVLSRQRAWLAYWPHLALLAALPFLLAAANPGWLYVLGEQNIDAWIYFGYFRHLDLWNSLFPEPYFGSRLSWILPGYIAYHLFEPLAAHFILHFLFFYVAVFSLYMLLRQAFGARNALLSSVLFATHALFLRAIGWDYVDAPGITYNLLGLACVGRAAVAEKPAPWLILAGAAAAGMLYSNLLFILFIAYLPLFYLFLKRGSPGSLGWQSLRLVAWMSAGFVAVTVVLGAANVWLGGSFWFYWPSIRFALTFLGTNPFQRTNVPWWHVYWLYLPLAVLLASVTYLVSGTLRRWFGPGDYALFFLLQFVSAQLIWAAHEIFGNGIGLQKITYATFLLPSLFLALASLLRTPMDQWPRWTYCLLIISVTSFMVASLRSFPLFAPHMSRMTLFLPAGLLLATVFFRFRWPALLAALTGIGMLQAVFLTRNLGDPLADRQSAFLRINDALALIRPELEKVCSPGVPCNFKFWYDHAEQPAGQEFSSVHGANQWSRTLLGLEFPKISRPGKLEPNLPGVILSARGDILTRASEALAPHGLSLRLLKRERVSRNGVSFDLGFFRTERLVEAEQFSLNAKE